MQNDFKLWLKPDWRACATPGGSEGMALLFLAVISDCVKWDDIKSTHPDSQSGITSYIKGATIPTSSWPLWRSVCPYSLLSGEAGRPGIKSPEILTRVAWAVSSCHAQPLMVQMRWNYSWDEGGTRDNKEIFWEHQNESFYWSLTVWHILFWQKCQEFSQTTIRENKTC